MFDTDRHMLPHYTAKLNFSSFWPVVKMEEAEEEEEGTRHPRKELIFSSLPFAHALTLQVLILFCWFQMICEPGTWGHILFCPFPIYVVWPRHVGKCARVVSVRRIHSQNAQTASQAIAQLIAGFQWKLTTAVMWTKDTHYRSNDLMHTLSCPYPRLSLLPGQSQVGWDF